MTAGNDVGRCSNADVDWNRWPVSTYLAENYRDYHVSDDAVIALRDVREEGCAPGVVGKGQDRIAL